MRPPGRCILLTKFGTTRYVLIQDWGWCLMISAKNVAGSERFVAAVDERVGGPDRLTGGRLELLAGVPAFSHLPAPVLEELASRLTEERFRPSDRVVVEGETDDRLYLIVEGRAEASTIGPSGIVPLAALGPGSCSANCPY